MPPASRAPFVAIACGGTGGHLFPGLAVGEALVQQHAHVLLFVSRKEVDRQSAASVRGMEVATLEAVGLEPRRPVAFVRGLWKSYRTAMARFRQRPPDAVVTMGGFTGVGPILAGRRCRARTFLHESNAVPGRANRWLAPLVDAAFVGFAGAGRRLRNRCVRVTGTPVRPQFRPSDTVACRVGLGLDPQRPVLLVMGGSQGASGINRLMIGALPQLAAELPELQFIHLTGSRDFEEVRTAYARVNRPALVHTFLGPMELALGAASVAVSRAGASSLAELAAVRLPAILVPYPAAADNHQFHNARAFVETGAARLLDQRHASPWALAALINELVRHRAAAEAMKAFLARWHRPDAAERIAGDVLSRLRDQPAAQPAAALRPSRPWRELLKAKP